MKWLHLAILAFINLICIPAYPQISNPEFSRLTTTEGLSQNTVFSILKDYKGFMWFATDEGLNKYDGYKFEVYKHNPENPASIDNNAVYSITEDAAHNLWVLTSGGFDKFDRVKESFSHYGMADNGIIFKNIFQDSKKRLWLGSGGGGFCLFNSANGEFKYYKNNNKDFNSLSNNYVYKITEDNNGELWIGTRNGLNRFNPETEKFTRYNHDSANSSSIASGYIKTVFKDSKGNIWAGTQGSGIALYNRRENSFINFKHNPLNKNSICHNDILSFTEDNNGHLWIGTENGGVSILDLSTNNFTNYQYNENDQHSISGNSIHSLYKDDIGNIWVGTWSGGVNFLPLFGNKFTHYKKIPSKNNSLSNDIVLSISSDADNNIWIGTDGGGLNLFNPATHNFINYRNNPANSKSIFNDYILSVTDYLPGVLALGFHRGGIDLFDVKKKQSTHYEPGQIYINRLTSSSVNMIYKDRQNNLWVGTHDNGGLYLFDNLSKKFTHYFSNSKDGKSVGNNSIFSIYETRAGQLWIGGDQGIYHFITSTREFIHFQSDPKIKQSISNNNVYSIMEDKSGNLWLGTAYGLNFFDVKSNTFTSYTEKDGLPNNIIWSTQQDHQGNLWISTNKGLSRFNPTTKVFRNYTIVDGLQSNTFKAKASYQAPDGEMFFGGVNGFNTFYPDSIKDNTYVPPVYITDFQVFNKPVGIGGSSPLQQSVNHVKEITLSYKQSVFTIEFASLNFTHPEQNQYAYKLDGFDDEWIYCGKKRSATYTNLDPGTYVFKVKGSNNDGVWNDTGTSVKIVITPPFWLTWWFMLFVFLMIAGSMIGFYLFRMNVIKKQKLLLEQKVKAQTIQLVLLNKEERKSRLESEEARAESETARQEADLANEKLQLNNKELEQFVYVASHDLQEPLRTINGFAELLMQKYNGKIDEKADKYLHFISDATLRMKVLIKDLLDLSKIGTKGESQTVDCNIILQNAIADLTAAIQDAAVDIRFAELPLINGYPTEIKLLFQNLLINAIKFRKQHTPPQIDITVQETAGYWQFAVSDNGIGIDQKNSERIFDIFQRLHSKKEYEGSGIGLAHCKKIVELHKGKIWVESVPGQGATFYFKLPIKTNLLLSQQIVKLEQPV